MEIFSQFWYNKGGGIMGNKMNTIKIVSLMLLLVIFVTGGCLLACPLLSWKRIWHIPMMRSGWRFKIRRGC